MSKVFVSSDHHFQHRNIIKYCPLSRGQFMKNDYPDIDGMNRAIIERHNEIVGEDDLTYFLGDFAFCSPEQAMKYMARMNGKKILVHGNHDRKLVSSDVFRDSSIREAAGLIDDAPYMTIKHKHPENGQSYDVVLFHFPIHYEWDGSHRGSIHLHGHCHGEKTGMEKYRVYDVGVDTNDLKPYSMNDIVRQLSKHPPCDSGHRKTTK